MTKIIASILPLLILTGCHTLVIPKAPDYPSARLVGYSMPNLWYTCPADWDQMLDAMAKNGFNMTIAELCFQAVTTDSGKSFPYPGEARLLELAGRFHDKALARNIRVIWCYNWNNYDLSHKPEAFLKDFASKLPRKLCGFEISEWADSRNTDQTAKAEHVVDYAAGLFHPRNVWNKGSRPASKPANFQYADWHICDVNSKIPVHAEWFVVNPDCGSVLAQMSHGARSFQNWDLKVMKPTVRKWLQTGDSINLYHFEAEHPDLDAIKAGGDVLRELGMIE